LGKVKENVMARSIVLIFLVVFSASVGAQGLSYDYVQGSYGSIDLDDSAIDADGTGFGISGSMRLNENFHITGEYQTADMDFGVDLSLFEAHLGYNTNISQNLDLIARIGYLRADIDASGIGADDDGFLIGGGVRAAVSSNAELNGGIDYIDFDKGDGEMRANAGFFIGLTEELSVGLRASFWDDVNVYTINLRLDF
jgi:opacity protein-like surface antigen